MRVFVAGATGAIGRPLVAQLLAAGHEVVGMTRSPERAAAIAAAGAQAVVADALDRDAVMRAVQEAQPEVVVNQLTRIGAVDTRRIDRSMEATSRLRRDGTANLVAAGEAAGARRIVSQSIAFAYAPGPGLAKWNDPLYVERAGGFERTLEAVMALERAVDRSSMAGVVLRYGWFYGPGTSFARNGSYAEMLRRRRFPIVGDGGGVWSFIHVDDAAAATVAAVEDAGTGTFNVVDDDPAPVREWLPALAEAVGAPPPRHVPAWLARLVAGRYGVYTMTRVRGASNARAKATLRWQPRWASWRDGFREALG